MAKWIPLYVFTFTVHHMDARVSAGGSKVEECGFPLRRKMLRRRFNFDVEETRHA